jgi:hypothetical protein
MNRLFFIVLTVGALFTLDVSHARAQFSLPGLPGVGGSVAVKAASKQLEPYFAANQPIVRDWSAIYPTVPALPGNVSFAPTTVAQRQATFEAGIISQLHGSTQGGVSLAPGDYAIPVRVFCTDVHRHAKAVETYLLGPLRGTRAGVLTAMYANAGQTTIDFGTLQPLSWSLQEGMKYEELPPSQQRTFDTLLPGWRGQIAESFVELMQSQWTTISNTVPGVPSFDEALVQMGDMGRTIQDAQYTREQVLSNASDFDALRNSLVPGGLDHSSSGGDTPWSVLSTGVYERLITQGAYGSIGLLEIHVEGARSTVPITSNIGYAPQCHECQPLTMHPLKGASPQPALPQSVGVFAP